MYAEVAINVPVTGTFHYHVPDELAAQIQPGQLVLVDFGTAQQHALIVELAEAVDIPQTKPLLELLDARPVVTAAQIAVARWLSQHNLMPLGPCLWLFLPPGLTGQRDTLVTLWQAPDNLLLTPDEDKLVHLLRRRGPLRGAQLNQSMPGSNWRGLVNGLVKAGVLQQENILAPGRVRPKMIRTAALAIHPDQIDNVARHLGRPSKQADLLEVIAAAPDQEIPVEQALKIAETSRGTLDKLVSSGLITTNRDDRDHDTPLLASLVIPQEAVTENLIALRHGEKYRHILRVLARENGPMDVSWLYAQTEARLPDLKRLAEEGLITLGEEQSWRDSLADRDFVPTVAPPLTPEQQAAWSVVEAALKAWGWEHRPGPASADPLPASPARGGGVKFPEMSDSHHADEATADNSSQSQQPSQTGTPTPSPLTGRAGEGSREIKETWSYWRTSPHLWRLLQPLTQEMRHEPTTAEKHLWQQLRRHKLGHKFRRQHVFERFIVDFYCPDAALVVEVDGEIHQYTLEEDAIRQEFLESLGLRVLRFTNDVVLNATDEVVERIRQALQNPDPNTASADPLPASPASEGGVESASSDQPSNTIQSITVASVSNQNASQTGTLTPSPSTGRAGEGSPVFLLHGVTGSGKTEIYLRAIELVLAQGRQAIFLVPEIALTAQTVRRVASRFPGQVAVVHGSISEGERYDTWRRARDGQIGVVVGARSALFTPLPDIGLIILDEEHDPSYKQGAGMSHPYYHARQVAEQIIRHSGGLLILGSATPDLETVYRMERGDITRLHLPNRIMGHRTRILEQSQREGVPARYYPANADDALTIDLPPVRVVDMREELKAGNRSIFSRDLQSALADVLDRREQAMLFLNRRGKNTYVFCRDCGYVERCPACDIPLAYHQYDEILRCHMCGYRHPIRRVCPACGSNRIKYFGAGTQHVEQELYRLFPMARVLRWDADTARTPRAHEELLQAFIDRDADVLIGTQMVAKGLDLPLVTLVGMVSADVGLNLPDFRAGERTFQLLTQVAGRAGRGLLGGQAILQTYEPEHYVIRAASHHDYDGFYRQEMAYRREMAYPPLRRMIRVLFQYRQEGRAAQQAERAAAMIQQRINRLQLHGTSIIGPTPCFFGKINYVYRWHLLVRGPDPALAIAGMDMPREWYIDVDPVDLL